MHISARNERFEIIETSTKPWAQVPSHKSIFFIFFISAWLVGWGFGEVNAIKTLLSPEQDERKAFMTFWLIGWTLGGAWALGALIWQLAGFEILTIDQTTITQRIEILGMGFNKHYNLKEVKDLRVIPYNLSIITNQKVVLPPIIGAGHGAIAFDYGSRTFYLGSSVDEAEAKKIVAAFQKLMPSF